MNNVTNMAQGRNKMRRLIVQKTLNGPDPVAAAPAQSEIAAALDNLQTTFAAFTASNDERLAAVEKGKPDGVQDEKVDRINDAVTEVQATVTALGDQMQAAAMAGHQGGSGVNPAQAANSKAFRDFVRGRITPEAYAATVRPEAIQAAGSTDSNPDGGYLVPDGPEAAITRIQGVMSTMRSLANVVSIGAGSYSIPKSLGGTTSGWVAEKASRAETNTPTISLIDIPTHEIYAKPLATQTLLDDANMDVEAWYSGEVAIEFDEEEGDAFISGTGVGKPKGFLSETKVANASWVWGKLGFKVSGAAATIDDTDEIIDLVYSLKKGYRGNAQFLMNDATTAVIRKLKDGDGNYIWQPPLQAGEPAVLLGHTVAQDDNMPDVGANTFPLAFGDFRRGYTVVDRMGVRVLRDPYSSKPYVEFYTTKRVGGGVSDFQAIKIMKCST